MTPADQPVAHRVLLVDDDDTVRTMMNVTLERKGFDVASFDGRNRQHDAAGSKLTVAFMIRAKVSTST